MRWYGETKRRSRTCASAAAWFGLWKPNPALAKSVSAVSKTIHQNYSSSTARFNSTTPNELSAFHEISMRIPSPVFPAQTLRPSASTLCDIIPFRIPSDSRIVISSESANFWHFDRQSSPETILYKLIPCNRYPLSKEHISALNMAFAIVFGRRNRNPSRTRWH